MVQSLLDLLCSQLKNLLSQAGVSILSSGKDKEDSKHEDGADAEKKDLRGDEIKFCPCAVVLDVGTLCPIHEVQLYDQHHLVFPGLLCKQHTAELHLGDFLVFLRRVVSSKAIQSKMASPKWTEVLLNIAAQKCCSGTNSR